MKKAKVLLTAITVLAIVCGAFAFKAKYTKNNTTTLCPVCHTGVPDPKCEITTTTYDNAKTATTGDGAVSGAPLGKLCPNGDIDCTTFITANL